MNNSIYIFGNMQQGYTQYPVDNTTLGIFQNFALNAKAQTQIAVHRDGALMYYGYIRKMGGEQYIGLCVLLNNVMFTTVTPLFSLFEKTIEMLAEKGLLIKFDIRGNIIANTQHLYMSKMEVDSISDWLHDRISHFERYTSPIPPIDYGVASGAVKVFSHQDNLQTIVESTHTNGSTFILKTEDYNTVNLDSYQSVLATISKKNEELQRQIQRLEEEKQQQGKNLSEPEQTTTNRLRSSFTKRKDSFVASLLIIWFLFIILLSKCS